MFTQGLNGLSFCVLKHCPCAFTPVSLDCELQQGADVVWQASARRRLDARRMSFAVTRTGSAAAVVVKLRRGERVKAEPVRALMLLTHTAR